MAGRNQDQGLYLHIHQLRSGFGSYVGAAAYGAGSCFEAVLQAASNSTKVMALRRAMVDVVFIRRYLFGTGLGKAVFALGIGRSQDTRNRLFSETGSMAQVKQLDDISCPGTERPHRAVGLYATAYLILMHRGQHRLYGTVFPFGGTHWSGTSIVRHEFQHVAIDAVAFAGGRWAVIEDMA